jgi:hypothetical protein
MQRDSYHQGDIEDLQRGLGEVSSCDSAEPNSKGILLRLRQHFVNAKILSTLRFCRRGNFVEAGIMSTWEFCQCGNFVDTGILSTREFCQHGNFVNANNSVSVNILSQPIFCRSQYFVCV